MLVQGVNLIRPDMIPQVRLSPEVVQVLSTPQLLSRELLSEWDVQQLVEPKVKLMSVLISCVSAFGFLAFVF